MPIRFDYTNMLADAIGAKGINEEELAGLQKRTSAIHDDLMVRRQNGELPFYDLPFATETVTQVQTMADDIASRFEAVAVLGIGGSALGTTAVFRALGKLMHNSLPSSRRMGRPRLLVLDNVDPDGIAAAFELLDPVKTLFIVISKSGSTVETMSQFLVARKWVEDAVGESYPEHFVLITDPEKGALRKLVDAKGYPACDIPPGVGGRFTVFTPVGLLPLACAGIDIRMLLQGAAEMSEKVCHGDLLTNPAYLNASLQYLAYQKGQSISVMMPYSDRLRDVADWYRQMWAESLGKKQSLDGSVVHVGPTPVKALGTTDQHSQVQLYVEGPFDKVVTFLATETFDHQLRIPAYSDAPSLNYLEGHSLAELIAKEQKATAAALTKNGRPNCTITLPVIDPRSVGALIYMLEVQTLFAGGLFEVDPLDQPGVEEGKEFTYALMGRTGFQDKAEEYADLQERTRTRILPEKVYPSEI